MNTGLPTGRPPEIAIFVPRKRTYHEDWAQLGMSSSYLSSAGKVVAFHWVRVPRIKFFYGSITKRRLRIGHIFWFAIGITIWVKAA